jgi:hypothetical protein
MYLVLENEKLKNHVSRDDATKTLRLMASQKLEKRLFAGRVKF